MDFQLYLYLPVQLFHLTFLYETDDFDFNQDFESEDNIKSPGWIRYQKRLK